MQIYDKARNAVALALSPVVRALVDPDGALQQIRDLDSVRVISFFFFLLINKSDSLFLCKDVSSPSYLFLIISVSTFR